MKASVYTRPAKPLQIPVTRRRDDTPKPEPLPMVEPLTVDKATECHVTPADVAARMVEYLGPVGDYFTLEPSAGTGQLVRALLASGHSPCEVCAVERHIELHRGLYSIEGISGAGLVCADFLEWAERAPPFPRIIMNPPFSKVRQHMETAIRKLSRGGHDAATLVALVPVTWDHPEADELERLPVDTFATTRVHTKIIRIER